MRLIPLVAVVAIGFGFTGCSQQQVEEGARKPMASSEVPSPSPVQDSDGEPCNAAARGKPVFVEISIREGNKAEAAPENCRVASGTRVMLRGAKGTDVPFEIEFPGGSPERDGNKMPKKSKSEGDRQKVKLEIDNVPKDYKYNIWVNGVRTDPTIIIER